MEGNVAFNYLKLNDLNLNAKLEKKKFTPGPLLKILLSIDHAFSFQMRFLL
jgi:hypothetical protein